MTVLGTAIFVAMALGLLVEAALALRRRRVLHGLEAAFAYGLGALGVVTVLSKAIGPQHGAARQMSGWAVAAAFTCCVAIDLANRARPRAPSISEQPNLEGHPRAQ